MRLAKTLWALGVLLSLNLWTTPTSCQLPPATPAAMGTANNYTVLARGFASLGLNPAGLGMPETSGFTLALLPVTARQSLDPLTFSDLADYEGVVIPAAVKEDWLEQITSAGGQSGAGAVEITPVSFSWNNFGLQLSTIASGRANLDPAVAELLLFGNAGRTGAPVDLDPEGSSLNGFAVTTVGISAGFPIARRWVPGLRQGLAVGVTLKQSWGHGLAFGRDEDSFVQSDPVEIGLEFPIVHADDNWGEWNLGSGIGLDVGVAWRRGRWAASGVIQNLFHTFEWDLERLAYRPGTATLDQETNDSDFDRRPATAAPDALQEEVEDLTFKPIIGLGGAYDATETLTLTAELRQRVGDGLDTGPKSHLGLGMEYRPIPALPLRAGFAVITEGFQLGGGLGVILGPVHLGFGALYQTGDVGDGVAGTVGLSFGGG